MYKNSVCLYVNILHMKWYFIYDKFTCTFLHRNTHTHTQTVKTSLCVWAHTCKCIDLYSSLSVWSKSTELGSLKSTLLSSHCIQLSFWITAHVQTHTHKHSMNRWKSSNVHIHKVHTVDTFYSRSRESAMSLCERLLRQSNWQKIEHLSIACFLSKGTKTHTKRHREMCNTVDRN